MIRKTKFSFIRALLNHARGNGITLDKRNQHLRHLISTHHFFVWQREEEFQDFMIYTVGRLQKDGTMRVLRGTRKMS